MSILHPAAPLLPPWATDAQVTAAVETILDDWADYDRNFDYTVRTGALRLTAETDAYLTHQVEGWLPTTGGRAS